MKKNLLFIFALLCTIVQGAWSQRVVDLSTLTSDYVAHDGDVLTGTINKEPVLIKIASGASVTLRNATIIGSDAYTAVTTEYQSGSKTEYTYEIPHAGIECEGNATIILEGNNEVCGHSPYFPGIMPGPSGSALTIKGNGFLYAHSHGAAPGIGTPGGHEIKYGQIRNLGHIIIEGGDITSVGGEGIHDDEYGSPGIGSDKYCSLDGITLRGGTIRAYGGKESAGIGECGVTPYYDNETDCGTITIDGSTVKAYGGEDGAGIGTGSILYYGSWAKDLGGVINIKSGYIEAYGGADAAGIGGGNGCTGGIITIEGGTIIANGGSEAAGIGGGEDAIGGIITISGGDITATGGDYAAGIGGGDGDDGGIIKITGGTVKAYGGKDAAGIGGGEDGDSGSIVINGGNVYASGSGYGVGIGAGEDGDVDITISINGGIVDAYGGLDIRRAIGGEDDEDYSGISIGKGMKVMEISSSGNNNLAFSYKLGTCLLKSYIHLKFEPCDHAGQELSYVYVDEYKHKFVCQWCGFQEEDHTAQFSCTKCTYNETPQIAHYYEMVYNEDSQKYEYKMVASDTFKKSLILPAHKSTVPADRIFVGWTDGKPGANDDGIVKEDFYLLWSPGRYLSSDAEVLNFKARYAYKTLDLATVQSNQKLYDGMIVTGTLNTTDYPVKITIADGATVTLSDANISGVNDITNGNYKWAGITCEGNATIFLEGANIVKGFYEDYPGIFVPASSILTIDGEGSLNASSNGFGAGIGGGYYGASCGVINIKGGNITATGGKYAAGIGSGHNNSCSHIVISGGIINAMGGEDAAGIGSGWGGSNSGDFSSCGVINIASDVTSVTAAKGSDAPNSIGAGNNGTCTSVAIGSKGGAVTRSPYIYFPLANAADNSTKISDFSSNDCDVTLKDRILYRDGEWNTLCLPFDVMLENTPLAGAEARTLSGADLSDGILTLNFSEPVTTLDAGKPYIIRWGENAADLIISSASDWNTFAQNVNSGEGYGGKVVELATDIEVSTMVGSSETRSFKGRFNGNGHTLTFHNDDSGEFNAPFRYVNGATIYNLHTTGTINTGSKFSSGLVAYAIGTNVINNCWSSIVINSLVSGDGTHGGFVAYTEENRSNLTLNNCLFDGSIIGADTHSCGGLVGWSYDMLTLNNCVCRPESITLVSSNNATFSRGNHVIVNNCYYSENLPGASGQGTAVGGMTNDELVTVLGDDWKIKDDKVIPDDWKFVYSDIVNPTFTNVTITAAEPVNINAGDITFAGTYDPITIGSDGDETMLYLASGNKLYWPNGAMKINAFRAYFQLSVSSNVRGFSMNFLDNEEVTGIKSVNGSRYDSDAWYTLDGRKLSGKPAKGGMYINNGRKLVVK